MWASEKRVELLSYRGTTRLRHRLEPDLTSYRHGFAWFCLNPAQKATGLILGPDPGEECRVVFQGNDPNANYFNMDVYSRSKVLLDLVDLGDATHRDIVQERLKYLPQIRILFTLDTHYQPMFDKIDDNVMFVFNGMVDLSTVTDARQIALRPLKQVQNAMQQVSKQDAMRLFARLPPVFVRNFHNDFAVEVARELRRHGFSGWRYDDWTVYRIRASQDDRYVFFESEPGELMIDTTGREFQKFRAWLQRFLPD